MPSAIGRSSRTGSSADAGRYTRTPVPIPVPPTGVDVAVTVTSTPVAVSQMSPAVTWVTKPSVFGMASWPNIQTNGRTMWGGQSMHIFPFSFLEPWGEMDVAPANPAPTTNLNFGTTSEYGKFTGGLQKMQDISTPDTIAKHVKVYGATWWMKHFVTSSGVTDLTNAQKYDNNSRVKFPRIGDYQVMLQEAAKIAIRDWGVRWFSIWNENKGYQIGNVIDMSMNAGTATTGMGYSYFYKQASDSILAAATAVGVSTSSIKIGGPYTVIRGRNATGTAVIASNPYADVLYNRPWGYMDSIGYTAVETFLNNVVSQGLRLDFLSVDGADYNKDAPTVNPVPTDYIAADDWDNGLRWHDWHQWLNRSLTNRGMGGLPIIWDECYRYPIKNIYANGTTRDNYDAALIAVFYRWCVLDGVKWPIAWGPFSIDFNGHRVPELLTSVNTTSGGQMTPYGTVAALFHTHFPPGTSVKTSVVSDGTLLTIANATYCIVGNKAPSVQTVVINGGAVHTMQPYEVAAYAY
jgi:hypothetical protein